MDPGSLFDLLDGQLVDIVDYASDIHRKGRPPKLAINASSWWNTNMTAATVQEIRDRTRDKSVDVNPIEKNILFYTLRILQLGIQLHFIFDGSKCPSNGGKLYPGHDPPSKLFRDTLTNIGVLWHEAPAEAEAECAKMEMEGLVDAVWSEYGDAFAFGCRTMIRSCHKVVSSTERGDDRRKDFTQFTVYTLDDIARQHPGMGKDGFVLHAILKGRSTGLGIGGELYNLEHLSVLRAAERGLARSFYAASGSAKELRQWAKTELADFLKETADIDMPRDFPRWERVQDYVNPVTSSLRIFSDLPQPQDPFLHETKLFSFLVEKFQWTPTQWVKCILPVRIVRSLLATEDDAESQHDPLKLECDLLKLLKKEKKDPKKAKATFLICKATSLDMSTILEKRGGVETMVWILRKANLNQQPKISLFMTPDSGQKGKAIAPGSTRPPTQRLVPIATPSTLVSNGEGPSRTTRGTSPSRRQSTPPSPTPTSRKRKLPFKASKRTSKVTRGPLQTENVDSDPTTASRKGKEKEVVSSSGLNVNRAQSPEGATSSSQEVISNKRPRLAVDQPSTPPAQVITANAADDYILISSDTEYGSFPASPDLAALG